MIGQLPAPAALPPERPWGTRSWLDSVAKEKSVTMIQTELRSSRNSTWELLWIRKRSWSTLRQHCRWVVGALISYSGYPRSRFPVISVILTGFQRLPSAEPEHPTAGCERFAINTLKTKLVYILFKNLVRTSKRTPHFTITKINWLTLFKFNPLKPKLVLNVI
jgi:hypothetical protein